MSEAVLRSQEAREYDVLITSHHTIYMKPGVFEAYVNSVGSAVRSPEEDGWVAALPPERFRTPQGQRDLIVRMCIAAGSPLRVGFVDVDGVITQLPPA